MSYNADELINPSKYFRKKRNLILKNALSKDTRPIKFEDLQTLQVNGLLTFEVFKENIGKIFPLILLKISEGDSVQAVERFLGMKKRSLEVFIQKHPRLIKACNEARKVKQDRKALDQIELEYILS